MPSDKPMIELAREFIDDYPHPLRVRDGLHKEEIAEFAAAFATQQVDREREECAKIAEKADCNLVAAAIRARKESR